MNLVYVIINNINNKKYFGITTRGVNKRWSEHKSRLSLGERDHKLYLAMRKYGVENFSINSFCCALNKDDLATIEKELILNYNTMNYGYNMTCEAGYVSDETRDKIRRKMLGRKITWYDKILESRRKNGTVTGGITWTDKHPQVGTYLVQFPTGEKVAIEGLREFCRDYNLNYHCLYDTLRGKQKQHRGFVLLSRFNDYSKRKYTQASGSGA